ncbi:MAG: hypothetical protein LBN98_06215 [Prevotellaceae bacterium]|jgi:uncharacterized protein (DUF1810 family)|nr:hypothetical protein [Prevotellaceae bacterium]
MIFFSTIPSAAAYERKQHLYETMHARYNDIKKSDNFVRYNELKTYVQSPEFTSELNHIRSLSYKTSKEHLLVKRLKEVRRYPEVKKFKKTGEHTAEAYVQEYISLQNKITSPSFRQHKAYLKNKNRHKNSEPYLKLLEFRRLAKSKYIREFFKIQKRYAAVFEERARWKVTFQDVFHHERLSAQWDTKPYWSEAMSAESYSFNAEEHFLSDGKNLAFSGDALQIIVRKETVAGTAWDEKNGFVTREFPYTSGMISTAHRFQMANGRLETKLSVPDIKNIYCACWLGSEKGTPAISIAHYCNNRLSMGAYAAGHTASTVKKLTLHRGQCYIFQLERTEKTLVWRLNGKKMFECANSIHQPLYIAFTAGVLGKTSDEKLPAAFEIDYVKLSVEK